MQRQIREAIKIGYVGQALRLKRKLQKIIKLMWWLLGAVAVALAVIVEVLEERDRRRSSSRQKQDPQQEQQDLQENSAL